MSANLKTPVLAALSVGGALAVLPVPALARVSGAESFRGQIIAPAVNGTRHVASSIIAAKGVFDGVGTIVEVANRPGDPDNVNRDDLVFPRGRLHIRSTFKGAPKVSADQTTCAVLARITMTTEVVGGTGIFRGASGRFAGRVRGWGVAARSADGTCDLRSDLLLDADEVAGSGTLSF